MTRPLYRVRLASSTKKFASMLWLKRLGEREAKKGSLSQPSFLVNTASFSVSPSRGHNRSQLEVEKKMPGALELQEKIHRPRIVIRRTSVHVQQACTVRAGPSSTRVEVLLAAPEV